ncbi:MAG: sigma-54 dependent transcriptional regulator [Vicinamibacteria bacterium]|jgi:DNA-binding NtrC family response regulator|nr:sigma-54 dependent transcriptional regulator [Vicinamibacteria bacterium]
MPDNVHAPLDIVARAPAMRAALDLLARLAGVTSSVLLQGESGTGKDLCVHYLHYAGPRRNRPLIKVHCPSIPDELLESELFGHERGAFTDAHQTKLGKIEMAEGGTLYFDQIQDLSPTLQAKLLRVIEERRFERLGGTRTLEADVRFVSSCNIDIKQAIQQGSFREDLYHRLSVVVVELPPLRARAEDLAPLLQRFLTRDATEGSGLPRSFSPDALAALKSYTWPGNVRELRSVIERAALVSQDVVIPLSALPAQILDGPQVFWEGRERRLTLKDLEQAYIRHILEAVKGNQTRAAAILGISRKALWEKRIRYGLP